MVSECLNAPAALPLGKEAVFSVEKCKMQCMFLKFICCLALLSGSRMSP